MPQNSHQKWVFKRNPKEKHSKRSSGEKYGRLDTRKFPIAKFFNRRTWKSKRFLWMWIDTRISMYWWSYSPCSITLGSMMLGCVLPHLLVFTFGCVKVLIIRCIQNPTSWTPGIVRKTAVLVVLTVDAWDILAVSFRECKVQLKLLKLQIWYVIMILQWHVGWLTQNGKLKSRQHLTSRYGKHIKKSCILYGMFCLQRMKSSSGCKGLSWQLWNWTLRLVTFPPQKSWGKKSKYSRFFPKLETETPSFFTSNPGIQNTSHLRIRLALAFGISRIRWAYRETAWLVGFLVDFFEQRHRRLEGSTNKSGKNFFNFTFQSCNHTHLKKTGLQPKDSSVDHDAVGTYHFPV